MESCDFARWRLDKREAMFDLRQPTAIGQFNLHELQGARPSLGKYLESTPRPLLAGVFGRYLGCWATCMWFVSIALTTDQLNYVAPKALHKGMNIL
jgi:hypothetical protein